MRHLQTHRCGLLQKERVKLRVAKEEEIIRPITGEAARGTKANVRRVTRQRRVDDTKEEVFEASGEEALFHWEEVTEEETGESIRVCYC